MEITIFVDSSPAAGSDDRSTGDGQRTSDATATLCAVRPLSVLARQLPSVARSFGRTCFSQARMMLLTKARVWMMLAQVFQMKKLASNRHHRSERLTPGAVPRVRPRVPVRGQY